MKNHLRHFGAFLKAQTGFPRLTLGVPKETQNGEKCVALTPSSVSMLTQAGFKVKIEKDAGKCSHFENIDYLRSGAKMVKKESAWNADIVLKIRQPSFEETLMLPKDKILCSFLHPRENEDLIDELSKRKMTAFALDAMKELSLMNWNPGSRQEDEEAINYFGTPKAPFVQALILGSGFLAEDAFKHTQKIADQVLICDFKNDLKAQCKHPNIVISTGELDPMQVMQLLHPGQLFIDVSTTSSQQVINGVTYIGLEEIPTLRASTVSSLFSCQATKLLFSMRLSPGIFEVDLANETVKSSIVLNKGDWEWKQKPLISTEDFLQLWVNLVELDRQKIILGDDDEPELTMTL